MGAQQLLLAVVTWFVLVKENVCTAVKCNSPGELIPNRENCRKYFKCSNGEPSLQSCPGNLIFDPVLKICNWPDSTTCIADLLPKRKKVKLDSFRTREGGSSFRRKEVAEIPFRKSEEEAKVSDEVRL